MFPDLVPIPHDPSASLSSSLFPTGGGFFGGLAVCRKTRWHQACLEDTPEFSGGLAVSREKEEATPWRFPRRRGKLAERRSYWGSKPGDAALELQLTLKGRGTALVTFGNQCPSTDGEKEGLGGEGMGG